MGNSVKYFAAWEAKGLLILLALAACSRGQAAADSSSAHSAADTLGAGDSSAAATPVHMAQVTHGTLAVTVSGPGRTDALDVQKVRAPFAGTIESLRVVIGDRVQDGETIGAMVSQTSQAALNGAQVMLREARTPAQRSDAERALQLAKQSLVTTALLAPRAGVVVSRGASEGDLLSPGDSIISIASENSIVFIAHIAQSDLSHIRAGQRASVDAPGRNVPVDGVVHGLLPADTSTLSVPVRIDLRTAGAVIPIGLFGTAHITIGEKADASIVPVAALLRDDVNGTSRVAVVDQQGHAHWTPVSVGVQQSDLVQIISPPLAAGTRVIISGQVGLPDGSRVVEAAADSATITRESGPPAAR
jgi:multidrug efflux pump subunit AcrA (membrane-fusion protein)